MTDKLKELGDAWRSEVVVTSDEVVKYNEIGYRTIEICHEDITKMESGMEPIVIPGSSYPQSFPRSVPLVLRSLRFFMVRDGESRIIELSKEAYEYKASAIELAAEVTKLQEQLASFKHGEESLRRNIEHHREALEEEQKAIKELRKRLYLMEGDIAKFRKEIGEQRWREVTMPETKT